MPSAALLPIPLRFDNDQSRVYPTLSMCPATQLLGQFGFARMKLRIIASALLLLLTQFATPSSARTHGQHSRPPAPSDPGYVSALATANRFLHAWQSGDLENGMVLISDGIRQSQNPETFEQLFAATGDRAFEISTGSGHRGRYSFPVVLLAPKGSHVTRRSSEITVVDAGKNDWVVDKLP
jgi:hypothetical protein